MRKPQVAEAREALAGLALFASLSDVERNRLIASAIPVGVGRGEVFVRQGEPCQGFYIVLGGQVKLAFLSPQGHEKVLQVIKPGHGFCEAMLFGKAPYAFLAQAVCDTQLIRLDKSTLLAILGENADFMTDFLTAVAQGYQRLLVDHETIRLYGATERIVRYLVGELAMVGRLNDGAVLDLEVAKGLIASQLNLTQEHFSRVLRELDKVGAIILQGRRVIVPDMTALMTYLPGYEAGRMTQVRTHQFPHYLT